MLTDRNMSKYLVRPPAAAGRVAGTYAVAFLPGAGQEVLLGDAPTWYRWLMDPSHTGTEQLELLSTVTTASRLSTTGVKVIRDITKERPKLRLTNGQSGRLHA